MVRLGQLAVLLDLNDGDGGDPGALVDGAVRCRTLVLESGFVTVREFQRPRYASGRHGPPCPAVGESEGVGRCSVPFIDVGDGLDRIISVKAID